jgi:hypothetical protein
MWEPGVPPVIVQGASFIVQGASFVYRPSTPGYVSAEVLTDA